MITAGSTISATLGGAYLGFWLKASSDQDQWWREQKKSAYAELIRSLDHFQHTALRFELAFDNSPRGPDAQEGYRDTLEAIERVDAAVSVAQLVASEARGDVLDTVVNVCLRVLNHVRSKSEPDAQKIFHAKAVEIREFARRDVGLVTRRRLLRFR